MNAPILLASFNYHLPSKAVLIVGGVALVLCLVGIAKFVVGRFSGLVIGGVLCGLITGLVFYAGTGKSSGLMATFYGCMAFAAGAVFGMILARKPVEEDEAVEVDLSAAAEDEIDSDGSQR